MALTRADYLEHFRAVMTFALRQHPDAMRLLLAGILDYAPNGGRGTVAERQEARNTVLNLLWQDVWGRAYDGHQMRHWLGEAGLEMARDIPDVGEPLV